MPKKEVKRDQEQRPAIRDDKGRWLPGTGGGPGRKSVASEREYYEATMSACSPEEWAGVVRAAFEESGHEDFKVRNAARLFLTRTIFGSNPQIINHMDLTVGISKAQKFAMARQILQLFADFLRDRADYAKMSALADVMSDFGVYLIDVLNKEDNK